MTTKTIWLGKRRDVAGRIFHAFSKAFPIKETLCGIPADIRPGLGWSPCLGPTFPQTDDDVCEVCFEKEKQSS